MRIGILADIHGDIRALEAALGRLKSHAVTEVVCLGDLVGYGSEPDAVVTEIRDRGIACVRGNHDRWALERKQLFGLRGWKTAALRDETWSFLEGLPPSLLVACSDTLIGLHHGSPSSDTECVTAYKPM